MKFYFKLSENKLNNIVTKCIKKVLYEGYSSKRHKDEIIEIAQLIYDAIIVNGEPIFKTIYKVPLSEDSYRSFSIVAQKSSKEDGNTNNAGVTIFVTKNTSLNTIAKLLMHEMTHVFDIMKNKETSFNDDDLYIAAQSVGSLPKAFQQIIYHLWIPTEFNAFQTTYDFKDENFNAMFERFMGYIEEAYKMPTDKGIGWDTYENKWKNIQYALRRHLPKRYQSCNADAFKAYFVKTSIALLKKLVKKWNGNQNTNFID